MDEAISLRELVDADVVQAIQDSFARAVGVSSVIFLPDGDALTRFSNPIKFCTLIQSTKEGRRRCFQSFAEMSRKAVKLSEPEIMYCFAHGAHFVAPIIIDGERKATMYAGQFRPEKFSPEQLKELEKIAVEIDLDPELLVREAKNMRTVGDAVAMDCLHSFFRTVKVIAELGAQTAELCQTKDALQNACDGLEVRVEERTAELAGANEELMQEVAERKAAEDALRKSETKYRLFTETSKDAIISFDIDGRITYLNRAAIELGGYSEEEALQMNITDILPEDQLPGFYERHSMRVAGGAGLFLFEVDFITKAGARLSMEVNSSLIVDDGKPSALFLACRDITGRKTAEKALRESEEKYRTLIENVQDGVFLIRDGKLKFVNGAFARIPGYTVEEILGMNFWELAAPEDRAMVADRYARMMAGEGVPVEYEFHVIRKNEDTRTTVRITVGLIDYQGKPAVIGTAKDVTGQKRAEDALRKSESEYQDLFDNMMNGLVVHRLIVDEGGEPVDYVLEKINNAAERILSWKRADMEGKRATELYDGDTPFIERYARVAQTGESVHFVGHYPRFKRWYEITSFCPMPGYFANIFRDVTERKETEDALRKSEEKYRTLFETAKDAIFLSDDAGKFVDVNQAACESLGYSREELLRLSNREIDAEPTGHEAFLKVRDALAEEAIFEVNQQRKDGTLLPVEITGKFFDVDGELLSLAIARDITERKESEYALRESEEKLRSIVEQSCDGIVLVDEQGTIVAWNRGQEQITGLSRAEVLGRPAWDVLSQLSANDIDNPVVHEQVKAGVLKILETGQSGRLDRLDETVIQRPDGTRRAIQAAVFPIKTDKGFMVGAISRDVTERKKAEETVRISEEKYKALYDNSPLPYQSLNEDGTFNDVNPAWIKTLGYDREEVIGKWFGDFLHPDWEPHFKKNFQEFKRRGYVHDVQFKIRHKDGHYLDISFEGYIGYNPDGNFKQTYCVFQDITERKHVEEELKATQLKYRQLFETMASGVAIFEAVDDGDDFIFRDFNQAGENIENVKREDILGRRVAEVFPGVKKFDLFKVFQRVWRTGKTEYFSEAICRYENDPGTWRESWVYKLSSGEIVSVFNDITERKQAEQSLLEAEVELKHIIEVVPGMIAKINTHTGYFTYCNPAFSSILGFSHEEFLARPFIEFVHPDDRQGTINEIEKQIKGIPLAMFDNRCICKNGSYKWLEWRTTAADENGVIYAAATDITEREAAEGQIKRSLREKDVLMHEIHHRVKNNLQVASSLLSMQARTTLNKEAIDVLSKSQSRIDTMALIHTQLYESGDLSELNMNEFVGTLSGQLFRSYPVSDTKITPIVHVTDRKFPVSVGLHVGLIINELLSNAIEHAFGGKKDGKIEVGLTASDSGRATMRVSDDGVGLPPEFDINTTKTLGLHLVKILVEDQLQGTLEVISDGGVTFNMEFDIEGDGGSSYGENKNTDR
ncbi:MAG: PAS domain S-box protein [Euryarchaeota archaeon]|nr:PAS domain S-box protein [Euryarchaeota archaeon]